MKIKIIGAGLAGIEAAWYLAKRGYEIELYEMRPNKMTEAHKTNKFAELVCSNSLKSEAMDNASGILKYEMEVFDSLVMKSAKIHKIEAGGALAVDREGFSEYITNEIKKLNNITIINDEVKEIDPNIPTIIATGPLSSDNITNEIKKLFNEDNFYFFDAQAPIIYADSVNYDKVYLKSRYDKGIPSYYNCPFTKEEFDIFYNELIKATALEIKEFEIKVFEACMPIEVMAKRGIDTLRYGPMKPVGLRKPDGTTPYAVVQLRHDDSENKLFNLVGFQTHLEFKEQKRVFSLIPGLENVRFAKYGRMHKNTYINAPKILNETYQTKKYPNLFFAGQVSGVEGYLESASSGIYAAINMDRYLRGKELITLGNKTVMGALSYYITHASPDNFQPMNANFGIIAELDFKHKKNERKMLYSNVACKTILEKKELIND